MNLSGTMVVASTVGVAIGTGAAVGGSKLYTKITGKPAGMPGSMVHILSNDKLDKKAKEKVILETTKEGYRDTAKLAGAAGLVAGAAAIATGCSNKIAGVVQEAYSGVGTALSNVTVKGNNLKEVVKNTGVFQKFKALPLPAKAAIAAATGLVALVLPIVSVCSAAKAGYIESKHEAK